MGGLNVKNTIVERALQIVAPHLCFGCGKIGFVLCEYCKYDIVNEPFLGCILCGSSQTYGICDLHHSPLTRAFVVGVRTAELEKTINRLKFSNVKAAARVLAELLHESLPNLPEGTRLVPIPTISSHRRQRGYDHTELITKHLAQLRNLTIIRPLTRQTKDTQHKVDRENRAIQAARTFALKGVSQEGLRGAPLLLIDDIITTGATLSEAGRVLKNQGATVWAAALAYQPLD